MSVDQVSTGVENVRLPAGYDESRVVSVDQVSTGVENEGYTG